MAGNLRDQLVKAGLATSAQAKKAERQKHAEEQARRHGQKKKRRADPKGEVSKTPEPTAKNQLQQRSAQLRAEKAKKDRALALKRNEKTTARALRAEIKQIILQNDQRSKKTSEEDVAYNFVHGKKVKRIYLPAAQREKLVSGSLIIVNNDGRYHFLDKKVADQIASRDPRRIIVAHNNEEQEPPELDEHYAKFVVPDDLEW